MIWIDAENNPSDGCSWNDFSGDSNCDYIAELVQAIRNQGKVPGIYSSYYQWQNIMGDPSSCTGLGNVPLWYAHYDNWMSFDDFNPFGGWSSPNMKQYTGDATLCGAGVDLTFY